MKPVSAKAFVSTISRNNYIAEGFSKGTKNIYIDITLKIVLFNFGDRMPYLTSSNTISGRRFFGRGLVLFVLLLVSLPPRRFRSVSAPLT